MTKYDWSNVDWSQAPRHDVVAWDINEHGQARWIASDNGYYLAPSFNYQGNWQDSLEERPIEKDLPETVVKSLGEVA